MVCAVSVQAKAENRRLEIPYIFDHEDKYNITVYSLFEGQELPMFTTCVYALEEDLYGQQFYKADFHMHTTYSDGLEPPGVGGGSGPRARSGHHRRDGPQPF